MLLEQQMLAVDGGTLEVFVGGQEGPFVCTSHQWNTSTGQLTEQDPRIPVRLVKVNPRGIGQSSPARSAKDYTLDQFVDDLEAVRRQLGGAPWVFMGYSAGGYAAVDYALRYPAALDGLITGFCGTRNILNDPRSVVSPAHPAYREVLATKPQPRNATAAADFTGWAPVGDLWIWYEHDQPVWVSSDEPDEKFRSYVPDMLHYSLDDRLDEIRVPTLIFAGRDDPVVPWQYVEPLQRIPRSEFVLLECGHVDMSEGHGLEEYHAAMHRFLTECLPTRVTGQ